MSDVLRPRWSMRAGAGQGGSNAAPSPHTPTPRSNTTRLTRRGHFRIMKQARVASLR
jgi:hypothetical protein